MAALSYKKLRQLEDEEEGESLVEQVQNEQDDELYTPDDFKMERDKEEHYTIKNKRHHLPLPHSIRSRLNTWGVAFIAISVFTIAVLISLFLALFLTEPQSSQSLQGAVATDSSICSNMSGQILKNGGSAVDATITALLCVGTIYPESAGIGGGGFMTVFDAKSQTVKAFNFRETAPNGATVDMFEGNENLATEGGLAVAVPGELAGMKLVHDMYGKLPWADLFQPVIKLARDGYPLSSHTVNAIESVSSSNSLIVNNPRFRAWYYYDNGTVKSEGDLVQRPLFAGVLEQIASKGPSVFYNGTIANEIVKEIQDNNGIMTLDDLSSYTALKEEPVHIKYRDFDVYSTPLPSGGPQMLFIINVMENMNLSPSSRWQNLTYQHLVETFKYSFAIRSDVGDPYCSQCDTKTILNIQNNKFLSEAYAALINNSISNNRTFPPEHYNGSFISVDSGTTHLSVIGTDGMAVAVTSTVNTYFGSKLITPNGIVLNNEMDDFSSPNITNSFDLLPHEANYIKPGKRPLSSTCPTILLKKNQEGLYYAYLSVGAAGGTRIVTSTAQVVLEVTAFKESVSNAVESKRLHCQLHPNKVYYEDGYPSNITSYLQSLGHILEKDPGHSSNVQAVAQEREGILSAHSDSRKGGQSKSYHFKT